MSAANHAAVDSNTAFLRMLPRLRAYAARRFRRHNLEAQEELTAEAVALAFAMYRRLVERGTPELAYATPLAAFACRQVATGRRLGASLNVNDVGSVYCARRHGVRVTSLEQHRPASGCWQDLVVEDRRVGPAEIAATRIDFRDWLASLQPRQRQLAATLAMGESTSRVAKLFRVSAGRVSQLRRELYAAWQQFHGDPTVATIGH